MKVLVALALIFFTGCAYAPHKPQHENPPPPSAYQHESPPNINDYNLSSDEGVKAYTTAMNWYLHRTYNYIGVLNAAASDYGWQPPKDAKKICLLYEWDGFGEFPEIIVPSVDQTDKDLSESLAEHIKKLKALYRQQRQQFKDHQQLQQELCVY